MFGHFRVVNNHVIYLSSFEDENLSQIVFFILKVAHEIKLHTHTQKSSVRKKIFKNKRPLMLIETTKQASSSFTYIPMSS